MKLGKIASLVKKSKTVCCYIQENVGLWIGDGKGMYLMPELTTLDEDGIFTVLGISEKQKDKIVFRWLNDIQKVICLDDFCDGEIPAQKSVCSINHKGESYTLATGLLDNSGTSEIFNPAYLKPISELYEAEIFIRYSNSGLPYIAVKNGMMIQAVIVCQTQIPDFTSEIVRILKACEAVRAKNEADDTEQMKLNSEVDDG